MLRALVLWVWKAPAEGRGALGCRSISGRDLGSRDAAQGVSLALTLRLFMFPTSESREKPSAILFRRLPFLGITENLVCQKGGRKKKKKRREEESGEFKNKL